MRPRSSWLLNLILIFVYLSSLLAVYFNVVGQFDPVAAAKGYFESGERDLALEAIGFGLANGLGDPQALRHLQGRYAYTTAEKVRDVFVTGALQGEVTNLYSGLGCLAADLLVLGDVRDLVKQGLHLIKGEEVDKLVAALAALGLATTAASLTGPGALADAGASLLKSTAKYARRLAGSGQASLLHAAATGRQFSPAEARKLWLIFQQTGQDLPATARIMSRLGRVDDLDAALEVATIMKKSGVLFLDRAGESGLTLYQRLARLGAGRHLLEAFKRNPAGLLGLSKFHALAAGTKLLAKEGPAMTALLAVTSLATLLALLPEWVAWAVFGLTSAWLILRVMAWGRRKRPVQPEEVEGPAVEIEV